MGKRLRILLAEDDTSIRNMMTLRLQQLGHQVEAAENGRLALEQLNARRDGFDLVILDVQMPEVDGLEVIKRLRADPITRRLPVLVVSASEAVAGMSAGADHFLTKPHSREDLASAISFTLRMRSDQGDIDR